MNLDLSDEYNGYITYPFNRKNPRNRLNFELRKVTVACDNPEAAKNTERDSNCFIPVPFNSLINNLYKLLYLF